MKSNLENILLDKQKLKITLLQNKRRFSQFSSMMSMNVIHRLKNQTIGDIPKKTFKHEINKVLALIKIKKIGKLPTKFQDLFKINDAKLNNILYYERIAYKKILASCDPYIKKCNNKNDLKINAEMPIKFYVYIINDILEHKKCRLYMRFKEFKIINNVENEFLIRYYSRMETKLTMTYLLNCFYNSDPIIYDYEREKAIDIYSIKNDFDFLFNVKYKNLKKFTIKDKKYSEKQNILPCLLPTGKKINELLKSYILKNKYRKIKTKYVKAFETGNQLKVPKKPINKTEQNEYEDLSELYNNNSDDDDDDDDYINYNIFATQAKIHYKRKKKDSNIIEVEKLIDNLTDSDDNKNNDNNSHNKNKKPIKLGSSKSKNKNTEKNEKFKTPNNNIVKNDTLKNNKINLFFAEVNNKNNKSFNINTDNFRIAKKPKSDRLYLNKNSKEKTQLLRLNNMLKKKSSKTYYFPPLNNTNYSLNKSITTNKNNITNLNTESNTERSNSINKTQNSFYILKSNTKTIYNYNSSSTFRNFKSSSEFIKNIKKEEEKRKKSYLNLKKFISIFVKETDDNQSIKRYYLSHSIKNDINRKKFYEAEASKNLWEDGKDRDMLIKNRYDNARFMKKNHDLERKKKSILKNLTCTKDIIKFGDIYK